MKKLGRKGMIKNWKKRFFVLKDGVITYYEKGAPEFPLGESLKVHMHRIYCACFTKFIIFSLCYRTCLFRASFTSRTQKFLKRTKSTTKNKYLLLVLMVSIIF
jgi:hypothetical protein